MSTTHIKTLQEMFLPALGVILWSCVNIEVT